MAKKINVSELIIREKITVRGGGVEIDLTRKGFYNQKMTAYQNYLGGGMQGSIGNDCTVKDWKDNKKLVKIARELAKYYFSCAYGESEELEEAFELLQERSLSAY